MSSSVNDEGLSKAQFVKKLYERARSHMERKENNMGFLALRKSKLLLRGDGPFKILRKINDNAYK
ncbi:hypothetical protein CR513_47994, partial [Mucuna pruriens]